MRAMSRARNHALKKKKKKRRSGVGSKKRREENVVGFSKIESRVFLVLY